MATKSKKNQESNVTVDGMMTFGKLENGLHTADFQNFQDGKGIEPFSGKCKVQAMRDGNVYMEELPKPKKRDKNADLYRHRQDNSTLSLGVNGMYYFEFWLPEERVAELPELLVRQANEAAAKMSGMFYKSEKVKK